jgi:transcriptional regulator GlxA family with amidase domain
MNIGIYIYDQAEVLDFSGPFEVFSTANRFLSKDEKSHVFLVGEKETPIVARGGFKVLANYDFTQAPQIDVLIVVGGVHTGELLKSQVIEWIQVQSGEAMLVASVCTGAFLLAEAQVITTQTVTTHWQDIDELQQAYPSLHVVAGVPWVDEGNIVTSGGISAGIDMSLHLVSRLQGNEIAIKTAQQMEYSWVADKQKL